MYQTTAAAPAAAGALAVTGTGSIWLAMAGFALVAAGAAVMRIVPRREA